MVKMRFFFRNNMMKIILSISILLTVSYAFAEECKTEISGSDMMKFDTSEIKIDQKCEKFVVTLRHAGKLPVNAMGHNIVILESNNLQKVISKINMSHGIESGFMPDMDEVLFKSKMIGGGQETTLELDTNVFTSGKEYIFICSFPGHFALMKGTLKI